MKIEDRKALAKFLKPGDKLKIAELAECSPVSVGNWVSGRVDNSQVEPFFIKLAERRKAEFEAKMESIK